MILSHAFLLDPIAMAIATMNSNIASTKIISYLATPLIISLAVWRGERGKIYLGKVENEIIFWHFLFCKVYFWNSRFAKDDKEKKNNINIYIKGKYVFISLILLYWPKKSTKFTKKCN